MEINLGDSAFMIICSALVFLMTPGLALFYGGMVRRKNIIKEFMDIRVESSVEAEGLDVAEHGETAYPAFNGFD